MNYVLEGYKSEGKAGYRFLTAQIANGSMFLGCDSAD